MNYNSVEEILSAGTTNMTVIRNDTKQDDGVDTITGVSWFTYNGTVASNIYASGNSYIGFGSNAEHLKVNRRDSALYSLYREEGTLYDYFKFLKIRWIGYSAYNYTISTYTIIYDVILWDTGDISLHMVSIPTSSNTGIYSLVASSTYSYSVSSSSPDATFTKTDSGFSVSNSIITLIKPIKKYLVRSGSTYYTIADNVLSEVQISELTSETIQSLGVDNIPRLSLLTGLTSPEIIYWTNIDESLNNGLVVKGTPPLPQIVHYDIEDMSTHTGIENIECIASDDVLFSVSVDDGQTWKYYNDGTWVNDTADLEGMNVNVMKSITSSVWSEIITSSTPYKFRCVLTSVSSHVSKVYVNYN